MMMDVNGREIRTGDVVRTSGGFFKNDNGLWFVHNSPGDPSWLGSDYSLRRLNKNGTLSKTDTIEFWPLMVCVNDPWKRCEAKEWDKKNAKIEVIPFEKTDCIRDHFIEEADMMRGRIDEYAWRWGDDNPEIRRYRETENHLRAVASRLDKGTEKSYPTP